MVIVIQLEKNTVRIHDSIFLQPGGEYFVFKEGLVGSSKGGYQENRSQGRCKESQSSRYEQEPAFDGEFGRDDVVEEGDVMEGLR